jgi:PAS domain S-box-containing protein
MEALTGFSRQQVLAKNALDSGMPLGDPRISELLHRALEGNLSVLNDVKVVRHDDGKERALSVHCVPMRDRSGVIAGVAVTVSAGWEEKARDAEARESEETLREVINAMGDALLISDLQGRIREVNREFTRLTGYTRAEVRGLEFPYPWHLDEEAAKFVRWISELRSKQYLHDFDMTWRHKDGHDTAISLNTTLFRNAAGEPVAMLNIARDIGERRRLANELATRNKQIEMLNRIISKANQTVDFGDIFETIAAEVRSLVEVDEISVSLLTEDREGMTLYACVCPERTRIPLGMVLPLDKTVPQLAIARARGVAIGNLGTNPEMGPKVFSSQEGLKSQLSIPVILNERILGTLNVASGTENRYGREEMMILQPIADQIGAMIDRSRLFRRVSDDSTYIHNLLEGVCGSSGSGTVPGRIVGDGGEPRKGCHPSVTVERPPGRSSAVV